MTKANIVIGRALADLDWHSLLGNGARSRFSQSATMWACSMRQKINKSLRRPTAHWVARQCEGGKRVNLVPALGYYRSIVILTLSLGCSNIPSPSELSNSALPETNLGKGSERWHWTIQAIDFTRVSRILGSLLERRESLKKLRLRTKLVLSLGLSITALTCATLLAVRHSAQVQVRHQIDQDARNALLTIQAIQHQREMLLSRKADMLANLAYIRGEDARTIQNASEDPWQSGDCDLFALANRKGKIVALRTTGANLSASAESAEKSSKNRFAALTTTAIRQEPA